MTKFIIHQAGVAFLRMPECHRHTSRWWRMWGYHCRSCARAFGAET